MHDVRRDDFHHHGIANLAAGPNCLCAGADKAEIGHRDAVLPQPGHRFRLQHRGPASSPNFGGGAGGGGLRQRPPAGLLSLVLGHARQHRHGSFAGGIVGDAVLLQISDCLGHDLPGQEGGHNGLATLLRRIANPPRQGHRVKIGCSNVQGQSRIVLLQHGQQRLPVSVLRPFHCQVNRILERTLRRQELGETFFHRKAGLGHLQANLLGPVGGQDTRPAGVGHDGDPASPDGRHVEKAFAQIEQLLDGVHPDSATLPQGGAVNGVGAGHRAGVRERRPLPGPGAAGLDDYYGLMTGTLPHRLHELPPIGHTFDVQRHHLGFGVAGHVSQEFYLVQVCAVAVAHELGDAQAKFLRPGHDDASHSATLGDDGHPPGRRPALQRGEQTVAGVQETGAIGTHKPYVVFLGHPLDLDLRRVVSDFGESRGDDRRRPDAGPAAVLQHGAHRLGRRHDNGQVYRLFDVGHRVVARDNNLPRLPRSGGENEALRFGVDGEDFPIAAVQHLANQVIAEFALRGGAYDGHSSGVEEAL